ncbi:hypothetical protein ACQJBY_071660 [Aegilops geniculata]
MDDFLSICLYERVPYLGFVRRHLPPHHLVAYGQQWLLSVMLQSSWTTRLLGYKPSFCQVQTALLSSRSDGDKFDVLKHLLALIAQDLDVSYLFPQAVKNMVAQSLELKTLVPSTSTSTCSTTPRGDDEGSELDHHQHS